MAAPNGPAQEKCVLGAIREARMTAPESTAWECHGTGTSLGDPIEVGAVKKVQTKQKRSEPLMITTSKSNIGHCEGGAAMLAMMKCIIQVTRGVCLPTLHVKTLNPHLDHASFDATYDTEILPYHYKSGHCQVSSFGVGGTNGHAIFWGSSAVQSTEDHMTLFHKKVNNMNPVISAIGSNPEDWELQGPEDDILPGQRYKITITKGSDEIQWEVVDEEDDEQPAYYSVTGSFNGWSEDRMYNGDVEGLWWQELEVPSSGKLEFRFLVEDDKDRVLAPDRPECTRRTARIVGPEKDLTAFWVARGEPGSSVRVELLAKGRHPPAVNWFDVGQ